MAPKKAEPEPEPEPEAPAEPEVGEGAFTFADGSKYDGSWIKTEEGGLKRHGRGVFKDGPAEEQTYEGEWVDDMMQGRGTFRYVSGAKYEGEFLGNKYHGHGIFLFPDGAAYEGPFQENQMHGHGKFTDAQGVVWTGKFYNGTGPGLAHGSVVAK
uniref:MORN repeat-containing protein 5 n=1 Tax=Haptolina brevifila TaxID=156173 RepID=A0A7S2DHM1_9EUKA|mmetsp:Transcript_38753/g.77578  ORF Transcript_38753/g.77578 Transcript_38753/m.77578 type:complete len:155 (+) Transcript_38753:70-534(+)|eukprot:CAMPEP_0174696922 /NCGR_PEP_ID=MMETSP1094-20130205/2932_1 /TAXON_ID=156173 /ORGANISM="Chrysochromulina brevifilum, Strain UTEX LB 985" /LENGTH=154 /DNA_ID=CAMNT_0015893793 /DNA_START=70 /DNA_END=534 /DNA_ORIENTATION=-